MAIIDKYEIFKENIKNNQSKTRAKITIDEERIKIETYGSKDRQDKGKPSQIIILDKSLLKEILEKMTSLNS